MRAALTKSITSRSKPATIPTKHHDTSTELRELYDNREAIDTALGRLTYLAGQA